MKNIYLVFLIVISLYSCSDNNSNNDTPDNPTIQVGHTLLNINDPSRNNRNISTHVYYPASMAGDDVAIQSGQHPVIVFGHGFLMSWTSYTTLWEHLVPQGYILCFPDTEMGLSPSHSDFSMDLNQVMNHMQELNSNNQSVFYNSILPKTALMGHSMGGGAAFIASQNNTAASTLVTFAAADTTPSSITAASQVSVPSLIFSGQDDCVTPPATTQDMMYQQLAASCKTQITITNGTHCYFADPNASCDFGESFCNTSVDITRDEQHNITYAFLELWLDHVLKEKPSALVDFNAALNSDNRLTFLQDCN